MAHGWKYWDNDFHEWRYYEPDESDDVVTNLYSGYKVKNDPTKLPSLKIYDLLEAGFDQDSDLEDDEIDERCRTSKILKRYQKHQKVPRTILSASRARSQKPRSQGQRFGLVEDRRLRRVVPNIFPTSRFSRLLQAQQGPNDELRVEKECPKLEAKITTKFLTENLDQLQQTVHHKPNPVRCKKGVRLHFGAKFSEKANLPNQLSSQKCKLIDTHNKLKCVLSETRQTNHHEYVTPNVLDMLDNADQSELIRVKIKNLDELSRVSRQRNSSPLSYTIGRCQSAHLYRLEYTKEKAKNSHEPMTCRKLLPNMNKQNAPKEISNIQIDFESALQARKNGRNTYRKYANTKKWETSLREAKQRAEFAADSMTITAKTTVDQQVIGLETESTLASRAYGRSMPPPPSPIPLVSDFHDHTN